MREEDLERAILSRRSDIGREDLEKMVEAKMKESPFLSRLGALLIILEEQRLSEEFMAGKAETYDYTPLMRLTKGLQSVSVVGRVLGISKRRKHTRLRLSDGTASVDLVVWDENAPAYEINPGDVIEVRNAYVKTGRHAGELVIYTGLKSSIAKTSSVDVVSLEELVKPISQVMSENGRSVDVSFVVLAVFGPRIVGEGLKMCEVLVTDGEAEAVLTAWNELADVFKDLPRGQRVIATPLTVREGELTTQPYTSVLKAGMDLETVELAMRRSVKDIVLKVFGEGFDGYAVAGDRVSLVKLVGHHESFGCVKVLSGFNVNRRGVPFMYLVEALGVEESCDFEPVFKDGPENVEGRVVNGFVECDVVRKSEAGSINTRYGMKKAVNLWLRVAGKIYNATAWGKAADAFEKIDESTRLKLAFPAVRKNMQGDVVISIDDWSAIIS